MLATVALLLLCNHYCDFSHDGIDYDNAVKSIRMEWSKSCNTYKQLSGVINSTRTTSDNKVVSIKTVCKFDGTSCVMAYYYDGKLKWGQISRNIGNIQQLVTFGESEQSKKTVLRTESYSNQDNYFDELITKDDGVFMSDWPTAIFFRPIPGMRMTLLDLLDKPAFKLKSIKRILDGNIENIQIDYSVDQSINDKQTNSNKIYFIKYGTVTLRPDLAWNIVKSVYLIDRDKTVRKWKTDYFYETKQNLVPIIKSVMSQTIDDNPDEHKMPLKNTDEYQLEIVDSKLPAEVFSLKQFGLEERTPEDYDRMIAMRKEAELKEANTFAPTPPGGFPLAAQPFAISPWWWLTGAGVALVLISVLLLRCVKRNPLA